MSLIGAMIAQATAGNPATINYNIFVATFGMLTLFYLIAAAFNDSFQGHAILPIVLDGLNMLFFFAGGTALAAGLGAHSCDNRVSTDLPLICCLSNLSTGLHNYEPHHQWCRQHQGPLPGSAGRDCIPILRVGLLHRVIRLQRPRWQLKRCQHAPTRYPQG